MRHLARWRRRLKSIPSSARSPTMALIQQWWRPWISFPFLKASLLCTYQFYSIHCSSRRIYPCCSCVCLMFFAEVCPSGVLGLVTVVHRSSFGLRRMFCRRRPCSPLWQILYCRVCAGLSPCGCFATKVALILSGGCLGAVVAGSPCGYFAAVAILGPLSGRCFCSREHASLLSCRYFAAKVAMIRLGGCFAAVGTVSPTSLGGCFVTVT